MIIFFSWIIFICSQIFPNGKEDLFKIDNLFAWIRQSGSIGSNKQDFVGSVGTDKLDFVGLDTLDFVGSVGSDKQDFVGSVGTDKLDFVGLVESDKLDLVGSVGQTGSASK